jgi:hypothetical protein
MRYDMRRISLLSYLDPFNQCSSLSSQKYGLGTICLWDPKKPFPDPGSRGQKVTGYRILDPQHWIQLSLNWFTADMSPVLISFQV